MGWGWLGLGLALALLLGVSVGVATCSSGGGGSDSSSESSSSGGCSSDSGDDSSSSSSSSGGSSCGGCGFCSGDDQYGYPGEYDTETYWRDEDLLGWDSGVHVIDVADAGEVLCSPACDGRVCGSDGCDGVCGVCDPAEECLEVEGGGSVCSCQPQCEGKDCGPDGCGGVCGTCGAGCSCDEHQSCFQACTPPAAPSTAWKVTSLQLSTGGQEGMGLDLDFDPATCAPAGDCESGIDNALALLFKILETELGLSGYAMDLMDIGDLVIIAELDGLELGGGVFEVPLHDGVPTESMDACDLQHEVCGFDLLDSGFDLEACAAVRRFDACYVDGGRLTIERKEGPLPVTVRLSGEEEVIAWVHWARVEVPVDIGPDGGLTAAGWPILGGAIQEAALLKIADELWTGGLRIGTPPLTTEDLGAILTPDIDLDGDDTPDAFSFGIQLDALPAKIGGWDFEVDCAGAR